MYIYRNNLIIRPMVRTKFYYKLGYNLKATTSPNIFLLDINFEKSTIKLHFLLIFFILIKILKINSYAINQLFKLQIFVAKNYT